MSLFVDERLRDFEVRMVQSSSVPSFQFSTKFSLPLERVITMAPPNINYEFL